MKELPCNGCGKPVKVRKGAAHVRCSECRPYDAHHKRLAAIESCFATVEKPVISEALKRIVVGAMKLKILYIIQCHDCTHFIKVANGKYYCIISEREIPDPKEYPPDWCPLEET